MPAVTDVQIAHWLGEFLWPFLRALGLFAAAPVFASFGLPVQARLIAAGTIGLVLAGHGGLVPPLDWSWRSLELAGAQLVIGAAMGLAMRVVLSAVAFAGDLIGLQMGFGFASLLDLQFGTPAPVLSNLLDLMAVVVFLAVNGHLVLLAVMAKSMTALPVAPGAMVNAGGWRTLAAAGGIVFEYGVLIALPVVGALMAVNLALGVVTRVAPQLNIVSVGFSIFIAVGLVALIVALPFVVPAVEHIVEAGTDTIGLALGTR